jgi:hypothetical protein
MGALPPDATAATKLSDTGAGTLRVAVDTLAAARLNTVMRSLAPSSRTITYILYACIAGLVLAVLWSGFRP